MDRDSPEIEDANAMNVDSEEKKSNAGSAGEDDEEYEIEEILDAKRGAFANGRMGYFVKWKGYDATENSWVDEQDIGGAQELVDNYWKSNPKKGKRKSLEPKRARKSTAAAADQESDTASLAKKRGRKSTAKAESDQDEDSMKNKRVRKATTRGQVQISPGIKDMTEYMDLESWEHIIETIDTVERTSEGFLFVYFSLKSGENVKERSELCRQRFPQQLLRFYESNLRWKLAEPGHDA